MTSVAVPFRLLAIALAMSCASAAYAQQRSASCCDPTAASAPATDAPQHGRSVTPGPKSHIAIGAVGGVVVALGLYELIEGNNVGTVPAGVAMTVLLGLITGGVIGWIVYKVRD